MDPRLLRAARRGDFAGLEALLLGAAAAAAPNQVAIDVVVVHHHGAAAAPGQQAPEAAPVPHLLDAAATTPQGDSALHVVAASGDGEGFLRCARAIYRHAARLLDRPSASGGGGDTPLHRAARAGNAAMVGCLLDMARQEEEELAGGTGGSRVAEVLEKRNARQETALHDAVRLGDEQLVRHLMSVHPRLARVPAPGGGMSPLYLAVSLRHDRIAEALHQQGGDEVSYSGPAGQTALHAAVLRSAEKILEWNKGLAGEADASGSTALHFAAASPENNPETDSSSLLRRCLRSPSSHGRRTPTQLLLEADPSLPFRPDGDGEYPIHVAAAAGNLRLVALLLDEHCCPECAGLRDARGRTFLHVAADRGRQEVVGFAADDKRAVAASILNAQDDDGNTALHLAVVAGDLGSFWCLLRNREVSLVLDAAAAEVAGVGVGNGVVVNMGDEEEEGSGSRRMLIVVTTTRSDGGVRQWRNAALAHVKKHRLFGVVHFAHASGVYDAYFFNEIRQIERCHGR
ncbi:hypothetical protein OsI_17919 [Oryza sativa Indica Group]|uniref:Glycosyltransferases n=1 Tax=Oryza sativa subsp. indica TaxID=39946 RepID=B8ARG3_ORYSI|nr:hypothetical protein OsI_17919 [Oryza sativa Indica Group]